MRVRFILLLLLTSSSQAYIPASTIDSDAAEINSLNNALKSSSPAIFHRSQSLVCEMINKCCPVIKSRLADYVDSSIDNSDALVNACLGNYLHHSLLQTCPMLSKFVTIAEDGDLYKYVNTLNIAMSEIESPDIRIPQMCSSDEAYAVLCDWTERHKMESCERKRLTYVAQHSSDNDYQTLVRMTKSNLRLIIKKINKVFPMINVIETTTSSTTMNVEKNLSLWSSSTMEITNKSSDSSQRTVWILITLLNLLPSIFFC